MKGRDQKKRMVSIGRLCLVWTLASVSAGCSAKPPVRIHEGLIPFFYSKDTDTSLARKGLGDMVHLVGESEVDYAPSAPPDRPPEVAPVVPVARDQESYLVASVDPRILYSGDTGSFAERLRIREKEPLGLGLDWEIAPEDYPEVQAKVNSFIGESVQLFTESASRSQRYLPMMREVFRREGLPEELVYLALVESGFNPMASSPGGHVGMWQIGTATGKRLGLRMDHWIDDRRDPEKSTSAAARYLKELYDDFSSWDLAIAGFNLGEGKVREAMVRRNTTSFWELCRHSDLSPATRDFVPRFLAALSVARDPEAYGLGKTRHAEGWRFDRVRIPEALELDAIARLAGTTATEIQALNPQLKRGVTPPGHVEIRVPEGKGELLAARLAQGIPAALKPSQGLIVAKGSQEVIVHRVKRGENLGEIARRYGTHVETIQRLNQLASVHRLKEGQELKVPSDSAKTHKGGVGAGGEATKRAAGEKGGAEKPSKGRPQPTFHKVNKGENLWSIARRYGVQVSDICRWNGLKDQRIMPGDQLVLYR